MGSEKSDMEKIQDMFEHINNSIHAMDGKLAQVINELKEAKLENSKLKKRIEKQEEKMNSLEREVRRKNLIIRGIEDKDKEASEETREKVVKVMETLGVQIDAKYDIDDIRRMGKSRNGIERPILLRLTTGNKKDEIIKQSNKLKGTDIWIDEDYPKEIIEERKLLFPKLKEARQKGYKAFIKYNKLVVNGTIYESTGTEKDQTMENNITGEDKKRKVDDRSPEANKLNEQLKKITRTSKN